MPLYLSNLKGLEKTREKLLEKLKSCGLCPRNCKVNRLKGEQGYCKTGRFAKVNSVFLHFGEEPELVGHGGSGTIFFSHCNLGCLYCQNYSISHLGEGKVTEAKDLAQMMLSLENQGAQNLNFVTPTHVIAQIVEALVIAVDKGLNLPLVYNCGGYESTETLKLLSGIFDIYMPDIKYSDNKISAKYSGVNDYWEVIQAAVKEMHCQVGDLKLDQGIAVRGLLVRHLVLPNRLSGSFKVLEVLRQLSTDTYVNMMDQYQPCYKACNFQELSRRITPEEYAEVLAYAKKSGLLRAKSH